MAPSTIWADQPVPLIPTPKYLTKKTDDYTQIASVMATVHNLLIRAFNTIYLQAPNVEPKDYPAFVGYAEAWVIGLAAHHDGEETFFFPQVRESTGNKELMEENEEQHKQFHDGLDAYAAYLKEVQKSPSCRDFSGAKLIEIMDSFKDSLMQHLRDEIPTLLALEVYKDKLNIIDLFDKTGEHSMGAMPKFSVLPALFLNHDVTFEEGTMADFAKLPSFIEFSLRNIFPLWNQSWWKFASCDKNGRPKPLYCAA